MTIHQRTDAEVGAIATGTTPAGPARTEIEIELSRVWRELLAVDAVGGQDDFFDLGGDSILGARLMSAIENRYHRRFPLSMLFTHPTIEALADELSAPVRDETIHIVPMHPAGNRTPLFCFHCATGHVLRYRLLTPLLDPEQPVYGLRAPDIREMKDVPSVEELAELYVADIRKMQPHGPYQICGFSFGGAVAFEAARQLRALGEPVSLLALLDTFNPEYYQHLPFFKKIRFHAIYVYDRITKFAGALLKGKWKDLYGGIRHAVLWRQKEIVLKDWQVEEAGLSPRGEFGPNDIEDTVVRFATVGWVFKPKSYPGRIHLFRAEGRRPEFLVDPTLGWGEIARGGVEILPVPGDHMAIMEIPNVQKLALALTPCLAKNSAAE